MNSKTKLLIILGVFVLVLAAAGIFYAVLGSGDTGNDTPTPSQNAAPDFTVLDVRGQRVSLSDKKGKPTVINFWATWCGYCKLEMPAFESAYKKYGDRVNFMMVDLTDGTQETVAKATEYIKQNGYTFPIYFDTALQAQQQYAAYSIPLTVLVDEKGNLVQKHTGAMNEETLEHYIANLLED